MSPQKKTRKTQKKPKRKKRPTYSTEVMAAALTRTRGHIFLAAESLGCDYTTIYRRIRVSRKLRGVLKACRGKFLDVAETALQAAVLKGEAWAICFALKTQGKKRGYVERVENEHSGSVEQRHTGSIKIVALRQEILAEPDYLEYRRARALDCDTGTVRALCESGQVENGAAPGPSRSRLNGHDRGHERN